jgi:hypothetical protein
MEKVPTLELESIRDDSVFVGPERLFHADVSSNFSNKSGDLVAFSKDNNKFSFVFQPNSDI